MSTGTADKPTAEVVWDALDALRRALNTAYWQISDQTAANAVLGAAQDLDAIQDQITRVEFAAGTQQFKDLSTHITAVNERLEKLKDELDQIVHRVETVTKVIGYIDQAVALAAKYIA